MKSIKVMSLAFAIGCVLFLGQIDTTKAVSPTTKAVSPTTKSASSPTTKAVSPNQKHQSCLEYTEDGGFRNKCNYAITVRRWDDFPNGPGCALRYLKSDLRNFVAGAHQAGWGTFDPDPSDGVKYNVFWEDCRAEPTSDDPTTRIKGYYYWPTGGQCKNFIELTDAKCVYRGQPHHVIGR